MEINEFVYVIDWGKYYSRITEWDSKTNEWVNIFPIKTELPNYGTDGHWKNIYEPNLTLKGTINKRNPTKLVESIPVYKDYKWKVLEILKHPKAGKLFYDLDKYSQEQLTSWEDYSRYTEENLLLLVSLDSYLMKCYILINESGVSKLTPEQYKDKQFNAFIEANLGKWDRNKLVKKDIPKELLSKFYDEDDNVLFGSSRIKGLVSYSYLDGKFSTDGKPIYIHSSISYDGVGNKNCSNPELIKPLEYIRKVLSQPNQEK